MLETTTAGTMESSYTPVYFIYTVYIFAYVSDLGTEKATTSESHIRLLLDLLYKELTALRCTLFSFLRHTVSNETFSTVLNY